MNRHSRLLYLYPRCSKEIEMYKKEMSQQQARISKMESEQACPHEIKKQVFIARTLYINRKLVA